LIKKLEWADVTIARTMWETTPFPARWNRELLQVNEIWVPSDYNMESFVEAGIPAAKLYKIGECADDYYENNTRKEVVKIEGTRAFNFLSVFNWNYRKGWDVLAHAFVKEFPETEDVALIIKSFSIYNKTLEGMQSQLRTYLRDNNIAQDIPRNIIFVSHAFMAAEMPLLYKSVDAFVLATRAEGWGRGSMEAMLMGIPVITTKCSGQQEFINAKTAYAVPYTEVDVPPHGVEEFPFFEDAKWAEPDVDTLRKHMRSVLEKPKIATKKALFGRTWFLDNFSRVRVARRIRDRLEEIVKNHKNL